MEIFETGTGQRLWVHEKHLCIGQCPIHNPSDHYMKNWPLDWREDKGMFERLCPHGVGHPDPDSVSFLESLGVKGMGIHGCCCGCCSK